MELEKSKLASSTLGLPYPLCQSTIGPAGEQAIPSVSNLTSEELSIKPTSPDMIERSAAQEAAAGTAATATDSAAFAIPSELPSTETTLPSLSRVAALQPIMRPRISGKLVTSATKSLGFSKRLAKAFHLYVGQEITFHVSVDSVLWLQGSKLFSWTTQLFPSGKHPDELRFSTQDSSLFFIVGLFLRGFQQIEEARLVLMMSKFDCGMLSFEECQELFSEVVQPRQYLLPTGEIAQISCMRAGDCEGPMLSQQQATALTFPMHGTIETGATAELESGCLAMVATAELASPTAGHLKRALSARKPTHVTKQTTCKQASKLSNTPPQQLLPHQLGVCGGVTQPSLLDKLLPSQPFPLRAFSLNAASQQQAVTRVTNTEGTEMAAAAAASAAASETSAASDSQLNTHDSRGSELVLERDQKNDDEYFPLHSGSEDEDELPPRTRSRVYVAKPRLWLKHARARSKAASAASTQAHVATSPANTVVESAKSENPASETAHANTTNVQTTAVAVATAAHASAAASRSKSLAPAAAAAAPLLAPETTNAAAIHAAGLQRVGSGSTGTLGQGPSFKEYYQVEMGLWGSHVRFFRNGRGSSRARVLIDDLLLAGGEHASFLLCVKEQLGNKLDTVSGKPLSACHLEPSRFRLVGEFVDIVPISIASQYLAGLVEQNGNTLGKEAAEAILNDFNSRLL